MASRVGVRQQLAVERAVRALELRKAGFSYPAIAAELGYRSNSGAVMAVQRALRRMLQEPADAVRTMELSRLDTLQAALWPRCLEGDGNAVDRVLRIMVRRADLLGLDAPAKIDIGVYVRRMAEEMGLDPDEAMREAERVLREARAR